MNTKLQISRLAVWLRQLRAPFFTASIIPVLIGTSFAYATAGVFNVGLFVLTLAAIVFIHAGANMANDYFDHLSGNDWVNKNPTPFSGGSQLIQQGLISPKAGFIAALIAFAAGAGLGTAIVIITRSVFLLVLGLIGLLGGYFYSAAPVKLGYRGVGELVIAMLFGILPVYGTYYVQNPVFDVNVLLPGLITAALIFLVILANEFPDAEADKAVNKRTLVVLFGLDNCARIYCFVLVGSYVLAAAAALLIEQMICAALLYVVTLPLAAFALIFLKNDVLKQSGKYRLNKMTILLHLFGGLMLAVGLVVFGLNR